MLSHKSYERIGQYSLLLQLGFSRFLKFELFYSEFALPTGKTRKMARREVFPSLKEFTMDWRHEAACRDEDPELFFPIGNTGPALAQIEEAKKVCNRCEVKEACLAWALESGQDAGVWGGLSEDERRALKRRAARNRARMMESQNQF